MSTFVCPSPNHVIPLESVKLALRRDRIYRPAMYRGVQELEALGLSTCLPNEICLAMAVMPVAANGQYFLHLVH